MVENNSFGKFSKCASLSDVNSNLKVKLNLRSRGKHVLEKQKKLPCTVVNLSPPVLVLHLFFFFLQQTNYGRQSCLTMLLYLGKFCLLKSIYLLFLTFINNLCLACCNIQLSIFSFLHFRSCCTIQNL